jgi:hypothetical protein
MADRLAERAAENRRRNRCKFYTQIRRLVDRHSEGWNKKKSTPRIAIINLYFSTKVTYPEGFIV